MSFLSDTDYSHFLEQHIRTVDDSVARDHIREKLHVWGQQYRGVRAVERVAELLASETSRPKALYLRCEADLHLLRFLAKRHRFDPRLFRAFLVEDSLWGRLDPEWFTPFPVHRVGEWKDRDDTVAFTFSDSRPLRNNGRDRGNDYLDRLVDLSRRPFLTATRQEAADRPVVLYVDYRKVKTLEALGEAVSDRYTTVGLIPDLQVKSSGYDHVVREPHFYLWPLLIKTLDPDIVHVNVGWCIQGLPFMPFVPEAQRTIVDFYDVVELTSNTVEARVEQECVLIRATKRYLYKEFDHFVHRCFDPITDDVRQKSGKSDVVSLVEYVKEPMYSQVRDKTEDLRIAYAGIIIQNAAETDSVNYHRFMAMVDFFARENLHLHIYPSPYLYGFREPKAVKELIRTHRLTNVHACLPLEEDELIRAISTCDYGMTPPADRDFHLHSHSLPHKIIAYLRAGLPILVPEYPPHLAALVREHGIGVVYGPNDAGRVHEILGRQDLRVLKENVAAFRSTWLVSRAAEKLAAMYQRALNGKAERGRTIMPVRTFSPNCSALASSDPSCDQTLPSEGKQPPCPVATTKKQEREIAKPGDCLRGYLLENRLVSIAPDSVKHGGSWQGRPRAGHPTAWDMETIRFFYDQLTQYERPGVLDIGANTGSFCLLAAFHKGVYGHAFEPLPHIHDILQANIRLNQLENRVKAHRLALTHRDGTSIMKYPKSGRQSGMSCLGNPTRFHEWVEMEVECRTLDTVIDSLGGFKVDFIKIDTEGCELFVLKGAEKLIREQKPNILLEYYGPNTQQFGYEPEEIISLLKSWGYTSYKQVSREDVYFSRPAKVICGIPSNEPADSGAPMPSVPPDHRVFQQWLDRQSREDNRLYYRDQSSETMASLARYARELKPSVIVELGTLAGLSLRTWISATERTKIYAVDLSFRKLRETLESLPVDLSRATLLEQDILKTDFAALWTSQDRVIFFVDAHDLPQVPVMEYVLTTALPSLPDGSMVVVDDLWFSEERLTHDNARSFLENRVVGEIDELQCFEGYYAPYHAGGSFMGFAEVRPLLAFVNQYGIELLHDQGSKHVRFVWKKEYLSRRERNATRVDREWGRVLHNPLTSMPVSFALTDTMSHLADDYRQGRLREVAERLSSLVSQNSYDSGLAYGLAVCLARAGLLAQARDVLGRLVQDASHPRYRQLFDDLVQRVGPCQSRRPESLKAEPQKPGLTIFAMPKPFTGHIGTIQKNAICSWTQLDPVPEIILFGDEAGVQEMAQEVGARHIPDVERNEFGTPLVNKLFETAQEQASHPIVAYVNADMILFQDFIEGVHKVQTRLPKFLLIGQRWDLVVLDTIDFGQPGWQTALQRKMETDAMLHAECGLDYFAFRKGLYPEIPPLAIGRTAWDNWLVMAPHRYGVPVVDGTEFITAVHQDHDYGHVAGGRSEAWNGTEADRNRALVGPIDNSAITSGATGILRRDGSLVETAPRTPWYMTVVYRSQRSEWLCKQVDRLLAIGQVALAACKCEETLTPLDTLLALKQAGHPHSKSLDYADLAQRYITLCTQLAQCYQQMGRLHEAVATYTLLLENPRIEIPKLQRRNILQVRDELACRLHEQTRVSTTAVAQSAQETRPVMSPVVFPCTSKGEERQVGTPGLKACISKKAVDEDQLSHGLLDIERRYRLMSNGTRAKYAMAVRLSDMFRRAGLSEKSQVLELEAAALKDLHRARGAEFGTTEAGPVNRLS